ncbi:MAG: hypothetical protein ACK5IB_07195 [Qingshengfaniella sp.]
MRAVAVGLTLALAGCSLAQLKEERALEATFEPITTQEAFLAQGVGRVWKNDEITIVYEADGQMRGDANGVQGTGKWWWDDDLMCSTVLIGDSGAEDCVKLGIKPGEMMVIPLRGWGAPFVYTAG